jgi:hypothetical protein
MEMDKLTAEERAEVIKIILAEAPESSLVGGDLGDARKINAWLDAVEARAMELHRRYTDACNRPLIAYEESRIQFVEDFMRGTFARVGLGLYLNGDPRGNPVGILTPKSGRFNTMGGAEAGWRL